ncbi:MAG: 3-dehydroquinate synthase [Deltaproteobacteria bacterium]|nr:3-dehydroquinate synthase [Deltaproteobacteria bacterium]
MKTIEIRGRSGRSAIHVGESLASLGNYAPLDRTVIVTDTHVFQHCRKYFPPCKVIAVPPGERSKTLETVREICLRLMDMGADRSSFLVGMGGGVVTDIAGFAASVYMRGIPFGLVPTSLLAQVDAGIGGKNGVNLAGYKNMVGVFNQPRFVICDLNLLKTLPRRELLSGFAEIVKHALIGSPDLFSNIEAHCEKALSLDPEVLEKIVYHSALIKSTIVNRDEEERGERRKLNLGHTFGHAIEKTAGISHGEAVSIGMALAARLSWQWGYLKREAVRRIERLLTRLGLPLSLPRDPEGIMEAIKKDKKRNGNQIHCVLLRGVGDAFIREMPLFKLEYMIQDAFLHTN